MQGSRSEPYDVEIRLHALLLAGEMPHESARREDFYKLAKELPTGPIPGRASLENLPPPGA